MHAAVFVAWSLLAIGQVEAPKAKTGPATITKKVDVEAEVKRLVKQLDAESAEDREAAEKDLVGLGGEALAYLPRVGPKDSAELKNRLQRVREALEKVASEGFFKPSRVTLEGSMQLSVAVAAIEEQTGNSLVDMRQEESNPTIKLAIKDATFWEAVDQLCDAANLDIYPYSEEGNALPFVARPDGGAKRVDTARYAGLFRVEASSVETTRDLKQASQNSLRLLANIAWEPRIHPIVLEAPISAMSAVDENGTAIELDESQGPLEQDLEGVQQGTDLTFAFLLPPRETKKIASFKCKMTALAPGKIETFEFPNLNKARNEMKQKGQATVTIEQTRKLKDLFEVRLLVEYEKVSNALESHRGWVFGNPAYLIGPDGKRVENAGVESTVQDENSVGLSVKFVMEDFGGDPAKCKFVYETPSSLIKVPVDIELKDIDLP